MADKIDKKVRVWDLPVRLHNSVWTADRTIDFHVKNLRRRVAGFN